MPTTGQLILLSLSCLLFAGGAAMSFARLWRDHPGQRLAAKVCVYLGIVVALGVLVWHAANRGEWVPLGDNFETLIWLGLLLAGFLLYVQRRRPVGGLDWFLLPLVVLLLASAAVFGRTTPHAYQATAWDLFHRGSSYLSAVAFFVAGATGAMYLIANRRLRTKHALPGPNLGSLERLEQLTLTSVTLGFALLSIGLITGVLKIVHEGRYNTALGPHWFSSPKVVLSAAVWVVYAVVLHSPINPSFRGRKAAMLSIVGSVLTIGAIVAVELVTGGRR
jgi:ABC-type uncharacterized transport system permease subunit